jgi:disulfide bond formation protein DsbB
MTTTEDTLNTELFLPIVLALLLILGAAAGVWFTQIRPPTEQAAAEQATTNSDPVGPADSVPTAAGNAQAGQELFVATCAACHGPAGQGVPGLGKDMTTSQFIADRSDAELVEFIKAGRDPSDPLNTTGVAMPSKGGNPALSDEDLFDLVAYIRTIHE